ncbi:MULTISPECIES: hypothetical protein [unclassified Bradyrhizobium]|uniref:hypothetical protein n=1 Tax=unclassified Bradyrhizobium TaxID=2631580 RepID=UPI0024E0D1C0|nr:MULTISPECIES: hypothetical protein [unclassified Bradyrhizobium]
MNSGKTKEKYFSRKDWTGQISLDHQRTSHAAFDVRVAAYRRVRRAALAPYRFATRLPRAGAAIAMVGISDRA